MPEYRANSSGCVSTGLKALSILAEALAFRLNRILILEDDVAFLRDLDAIETTFAAMPQDADIWQMDNFVALNREAGARIKELEAASQFQFTRGLTRSPIILFQFTPVLRRATCRACGPRRETWVSIHARLATGDKFEMRVDDHINVSIHARLATGDGGKWSA